MNYKELDLYNFPTIWASYLINGDPSGLDQSDIEQCDKECKDLGYCIDVSEESHFGTFKGIGHDLSEFTFRKMLNQDLETIKKAYPDKEFLNGGLDGYNPERSMTYKMLYPSGWRYLTIQVLDRGQFTIILTVGNYGTDITNYKTVEEVIKALEFRF